MKNISFFTGKIISFIFILGYIITAQSLGNNSISGFVLDATDRSPVSEVYVELLNDTYSTLKRVRTDGSGRFFFGGISSGNFKVKVLPYGTNYAEQEQDATIINNRFGNTVTSDSVYLDIYLTLDKRKINIDNSGTVGIIFVQEVPAEATRLFKASLSNFEKNSNPNLGIENLKKALELYPDYYDALNKLGIEYVKQKKYYESLPYLIKAIKVNNRSYSSFYMLGLAAYNLKQFKEAAEAFKAAIFLSPQSVYAHIQYGMVLRINGMDKEAEDTLLKAVSISKDTPMAETHWQLALLYYKLERFDDSAKQLEKYLKILPDSSNDKQIKDLILAIRGKTQKKS